MTPPPSLPSDWWQLSKTPMTAPPPGQSFDCLSMNLTRVVQYQGDVWIWIGGPYPSRGTPPPPQSSNVPRSKIFWFPPRRTTNVRCTSLTISHYLYNISVNRISFYWVGEQYTLFCFWLIQIFIHKPFSLLPLEWTALLTIAWFTVSYSIHFMLRRLSF